MKLGASNILKIILIAAVALLAVLFVFGIVMIIGWPWWVGFFVLIGLLGLCVGLVFLKKLWIKRNEEQFVHQVIEQGDAYAGGMGEKEREASKELQEKWKEAVNALKASHLKKQGNPLYVLPWYLVIGESGTGKTTAIKSARLSSPFTEVSKTSGISGTRNCDWWFFEQAVILDTAGRYAIQVDKERDKAEWEKFLAQLVKFRKKEPINGLIVTVAADKILQSGPEVLEDDGRNIRRRIDELMRVLGAKFPVYVLVTKCDLIQGMTQFCEHIPEQSLDQPMGVLNQEVSTDIAKFLDRSFFSIGERLRDLRLLLFQKTGDVRAPKGTDPALLLFPEEFERLKPGLHAFIKGTFQENPYQESPILRGVFYSSGRQEGRPFSHFLKALGLIGDEDVLPGTSKGLFLHELFAKILPRDRKLFMPTQRSLQWNRLTKNMGLTSWVTLVIALCGLLSFSFVKNLGSLRLVSHEFKSAPVLQGELISDASILDRFRKAIQEVEARNRSWWIPRFGLYESVHVENRLKERYCQLFKDGFLIRFDQHLAERMARFSALTAKAEMGPHVAHMVRRINMLRTRLEGSEMERLSAMPQPNFGPQVLVAGRSLIPEIRDLFQEMYFCYAAWAQDEGGLNREMNALQKYLKHVLTLEGIGLEWIVTWVDQNLPSAAVTLGEFWGGGDRSPEEAVVPAAFTLKGKAAVDAFLRDMELALTEPVLITTKKTAFERWYGRHYILAWQEFISFFPQGKATLKSRDAWQQMVSRTATKRGPFLSLLARITEELTPFSGSGDEPPAWVRLAYEFKEFLAASKLVTRDDKGFMSKLAQKGKPRFSRFGKTRGLEEGEIMELQMKAATALHDYLAALTALVQSSASRPVAYETAEAAYAAQDPTAGETPFFKAAKALTTFKSVTADLDASEKVFWDLIQGPLDVLLVFVSKETACYLQTLWEKEVLVEIQGVYERQRANRILFGSDGYADKYIRGPAAPFLSRDTSRGYHAKTILGTHVPFSKDFLEFITKGAKVNSGGYKSRYAVTIRAQPTDTGFRPSFKGPRLGVDTTTIEMQCADKNRTLVNYNYPVKKTFIWEPNNCSDVTFTINVGKLMLTRTYSGFYGFPKFLSEFSKGQHIFYPGEFPESESALRRMGIRYIKVKYQFGGYGPVLRLYRNTPGKAPGNIAECWEQ